MEGLPTFSRRDWHRRAGLALLGAAGSSWFSSFAATAAEEAKKNSRHCILLWMPGGPSQIDTFDLKPDHANGGEFKPISTSVSGIQISEHLPNLAKQADRLAIVRSIRTTEGDHSRAAFLMRTGQKPGGPIPYPTMGSLFSKELGELDADLPNYVSIAPNTTFNPNAFSPGFLGPRYAAATVGATSGPAQQAAAEAGFASLGVDNLVLPSGVTGEQAEARLQLWERFQSRFVAGAGPAAIAQDTLYRRALRMMKSNAAAAFDLSQEPDEVRERYGKGRFGQGCLMARRLIERGVPFVEVSLSDGSPAGWDTHIGNFSAVKSLSSELDAGWSTLMQELADRGLLANTTILWMGEFGRTPNINNSAGRDHFPDAWSCVFAGGGIRGGQVYGQTSKDGMEVTDGPVAVGDILATLCRAVGLDPDKENITEEGRPIKLAEGKPLEPLLG